MDLLVCRAHADLIQNGAPPTAGQNPPSLMVCCADLIQRAVRTSSKGLCGPHSKGCADLMSVLYKIGLVLDHDVPRTELWPEGAMVLYG